MKCALCHGEIKKKAGQYQFQTIPLGNILVPDISFQECEGCGEKTLSFEESSKLFDYVKDLEGEKIKELPSGDLITLNEAAAILDVTKQAFSKNPKIKRGLIYSVKIGDRRFYSEKSVRLYLQSDLKDGRFPLTAEMEVAKPEIRYIVLSMPYISEERRYLGQGVQEPALLWAPSTFNSNFGANYGD